MAIQNPNSCKQGYDPDHADHPFHTLIVSFGYVYSHSTPIIALDGTEYIHHTYKHGEHNVGIDDRTPNIWQTSVSCSSGHHWQGLGAVELRAHLASKARRYGLRRS